MGKWICPVNIKDVLKLQEWLAKEELELVEFMKDYDVKAHSETENYDLRLRYIRFINLWNYDNTVNKKEKYFCCPKVQAAVVPIKCMSCPYGHMAFDCHWPYTCNESDFCTHYAHQEVEE